MELLRVDSENPDERTLTAAAEVILRGGVLAFPTDTLYGLACSLFDESAVAMIARLKRRDPKLAVISLIPDAQQAYGLASRVPEVAERLMERFWPGPLSLIFKAGPLLPINVLGAGGTVALRVPADTLSHRLLDVLGGPVVSSSANISGQPPAETAQEVIEIFGNQIDLILDAGPRRGDMSSTLVDVSSEKPRLIRRGPVDVTSELGDFDDHSGVRSV